MSRVKRIIAASMMVGGLSTVSVPLASAVVNGEQATSNAETRSIVGIQTPAMGKEGMVDNCTGTVVAPDWILTASHCVLDQDSVEEVAVVAHGTTYGNATFSVDGENVQKFNKVVFGRSQVFKPSDGTDIALIRLPRALPGVSPATIASTSKPAGGSGLLYGWGIPATETHKFGEKLLVAPSTIAFNGLPRDFKELGNNLGVFEKYSNGTYYYTTQVSPATAVQGDSGGPLMINGVVSGVTSQLVSDLKTDTTLGVLSTDVGAHADWIKETIGSSKASRHVDVAAGVGGVVNGKNVLPFTVANVGSDEVADVNVEVSPPAGSALPVGSKIVVSKTKYKAGESSKFEPGDVLDVETYTPTTDSSNESRSFTVKVPVNLKAGEGVQLRLEVPEAVEGGDYRVLAYAVPGVRPGMFALDATNKCDQGADRDNCASVMFGTGSVQDAVINARGFASGVRFEGASSEGSVDTSGTESSASPSTGVDVPSEDGKPSDGGKTSDQAVENPSSNLPSSSVSSSVVNSPSPALTKDPKVPSVDNSVTIPGDAVIVGKPDSRSNDGVSPVVGGDSANQVDVPTTVMPVPVEDSVEDSSDVVDVPVVGEQPAASQRILADTGVSGVLGVVGVGLLAVFGGFMVRRRR